MTACDYKFFPAQAAHTKTLKLQQKKGQSKPSSPSYYNKSLVPTSALAFITIVRAGENKNNSGHSKINLTLISPRLSLKRKTADDSAKTGKSLGRFSRMLPKVPAPFPTERKNKEAFSLLAILETAQERLRCSREPTALLAASVNDSQLL